MRQRDPKEGEPKGSSLRFYAVICVSLVLYYLVFFFGLVHFGPRLRR